MPEMILPQGLNVLSEHPLFKASQPGRAVENIPLGFIDIGARGGMHELVYPIAKSTAVLGFEPDDAACKELLQDEAIIQLWAAFHLEPVALGEREGAAELVLLSAATNHSLLPPNTGFTNRYRMEKWREVGRCPLTTVSLDHVMEDPKYAHSHFGEFIKLDTQGTEYEILKGAVKTLKKHTVAIVTEVAFCELYRGQKLFSEVEMLLREQGFSFYGFMPIHTRSQKYLDKKMYGTIERAMYADAVFFKDPLPGSFYHHELPMRSHFVLFITAMLLGFYDFALEIANMTWLKTADEDERARIHALVKHFSMIDPKKTQSAANSLVKMLNEDPSHANIIVGNFVDRRRHSCDYDDVLNVSPLPKLVEVL